MLDLFFHRREMDPNLLEKRSDILCLFSVDLCLLKCEWLVKVDGHVSDSPREYSACIGEQGGEVEHRDVCLWWLTSDVSNANVIRIDPPSYHRSLSHHPLESTLLSPAVLLSHPPIFS